MGTELCLPPRMTGQMERQHARQMEIVPLVPATSSTPEGAPPPAPPPSSCVHTDETGCAVQPTPTCLIFIFLPGIISSHSSCPGGNPWTCFPPAATLNFLSVFETGPDVAQPGLKLICEAEDDLELRYSCRHLPIAGITGMHCPPYL